MRRTPQGVDLTVMNYINHQPVPVYSSDAQPLMPTHPARARKLMQQGRAVPHHVKGLFGIRLLDRTREQSSVQDVAINIDPGSQTTGIAVVGRQRRRPTHRTRGSGDQAPSLHHQGHPRQATSLPAQPPRAATVPQTTVR